MIERSASTVAFRKDERIVYLLLQYQSAKKSE